MADKVFIVSHRRARAPITVRGKNLEEALASEGLDPNIWKPIMPPQDEINPPDRSSED